MTPSIAFVGAGPTTLYALAALLGRDPEGVRIAIFEAQPTPGIGSPYRPGWNDPAMLSNIASIEIPPLCETLLEWLARQSRTDLTAMGVEPDELDDRAFYPRVVLGRYFHDQFTMLVARARAAGVEVDLRTRCRVLDVTNVPAGMLLTFAARGGGEQRERFDHVVLATGHQWPKQQEVRPGYFLSPWPATALADVAPVAVGIRGSSLTAIDAAVALANLHGAFVNTGQDLIYRPDADTSGFSVTMMSRKGLLPEADFYFPLPHTPLSICTDEALEGLIDAGGDDLLDAAFDLFRRELLAVDPDYARTVALEDATLETFCEAYFGERAAADPFDWAERNLEEARRNHADRVTVPWRYAILRMHEVLAAIVPHLDGAQFERFNRHFKPVFVDDYGAVPHESIERMLALRRAGRLEVLALGDDYRLDTHRPEGGVVLHRPGEVRHFPVFVEATGQRPLPARAFPFPSLIRQGVVRDEATDGPAGSPRGIVIDDAFHPIADDVPADRLFCLSLPFIMGRHPFIQGITSSHEMGEIVGEALARAVGATLQPAEAA